MAIDVGEPVVLQGVFRDPETGSTTDPPEPVVVRIRVPPPVRDTLELGEATRLEEGVFRLDWQPEPDQEAVGRHRFVFEAANGAKESASFDAQSDPTE